MQKHEYNLAARINGNGLSPLSGASVTVTDIATGLPASLYSDNGATPLAQPLTTDDTGYYGFYAADGRYLLTFSGARFPTFTREVILEDPKDNPYATKSELASGTGSSLVTFTQAGAGAVARSLQDKGRDVVNVSDFGAKFDGVTDDGPAFNAAILELAKRGGGTLNAGSGTAKIITPILWPSNVEIRGRGAILSGNGSNTLIKSGALVSGALVDITTEYGTSAQGAGTNLVLNGGISGVRLANAACGIRGHRLNYGTTIDKCIFDATLTNSYITSHSWGIKVSQNLIYAPAIMKDFCDWSEVSGNSFEGPYGTTPAALTIATGGYGGSYSLRIMSNGFHHWTKGIDITCETTNIVIESNHSEDMTNFVTGSAQNIINPRIRHNWVKANLAVAGACSGIVLPSCWDGEIGPNYFSTDGASTWASKVTLSTTNCFGWSVVLPYSPTGALDLTGYTLNDCGTVTLRGGSNDPAKVQPTIEAVSGGGIYTVEKYKSRYHDIPNTIPYCTTTYNAGTITIDTWISCAAAPYGVKKKVLFDLFINGATSYILNGSISMLLVKTDFNHDFYAGTPSALVITPSNNAGKLRITITGAPAVGNITGWVKEA